MSGTFDAGAITGSLQLDLSGFTSAITKGTALGTGFATLLTQGLAGALSAVASAAKEAGSWLGNLVDGLSHQQYEVAQTAQSLGVSTEFLDGWSKAAVRAGGNASDVAEMMNHLSRTAMESLTDRTGDSAKAFRALGVNVLDSSGHLKPMQSLMNEMADAMARVTSGALRNSLAQATMGRSGTETLKFLGQGSQAINDYVESLRRMGDLTTDATARSARDWVLLTGEVSDAWEGMKAQLAEPVRESLMPLLEKFVTWVREHPNEIKGAMQEIATVVKQLMTDIGHAVREAIKDLQGLLPVAKEVGNAFNVAHYQVTGRWLVEQSDQQKKDRARQGLGYAAPELDAVIDELKEEDGGGNGAGSSTSAGIGNAGGSPGHRHHRHRSNDGGGGGDGGLTINTLNVNVQGSGMTATGNQQAGQALTAELEKHRRQQEAVHFSGNVKKNVVGH